MGEYVSTMIQLGGPILRPVAADLARMMTSYDLRVDFDGAGPRIDNLGACFGACEVNYGDLGAVTAICHQRGIAYQQWIDACSGDPADIRRFDGESFASGPADGLHPCLRWERLLAVESLATGLGDLIREAKWWCAPLPPVTIIESTAASETLTERTTP